MIAICKNEEENFAKHFLRPREKGDKQKEKQYSGPSLRSRKQEGKQLFAVGVLHPPLGESLYTHSSPRQKEQGSFRAFGTGG
jgi:hypothetical protein